MTSSTTPNRPRIPAPSTLSDAARARLDAMTPGHLDYPPLKDHAAWRQHVADMNGALGQSDSGALQGGGDGGLDGVASVQWRSLAGVRVVEAQSQTPLPGAQDKVLLDIHGGALLYLGGELVKPWACARAAQTGLRTLSVDYRMPPDAPYPAGLDDCLAVYRALVEEVGADNVVVAGMSAGGNLAAALMLRAGDAGLPPPAALVLLSPEVDLTEAGDTFRVLDGIDALAPLMPVNLLYAAGQALDQPYLSPLHGDVSGFPPTFLQSGTRDLFLSNTVLMHRKLRRAGVAAELHVWEAMPHGGFGGTPEDADLDAELRRFLQARCN